MHQPSLMQSSHLTSTSLFKKSNMQTFEWSSYNTNWCDRPLLFLSMLENIDVGWMHGNSPTLDSYQQLVHRLTGDVSPHHHDQKLVQIRDWSKTSSQISWIQKPDPSFYCSNRKRIGCMYLLLLLFPHSYLEVRQNQLLKFIFIRFSFVQFITELEGLTQNISKHLNSIELAIPVTKSLFLQCLFADQPSVPTSSWPLPRVKQLNVKDHSSSGKESANPKRDCCASSSASDHIDFCSCRSNKMV